MGIRKHFEQQKQEKDFKISDLSLDTQEKEKLKFDPETEISDTDWEEMKDKLEELRKNDLLDFAILAMRMSILRPDQKSELQIDDEAWQETKAILNRFRGWDWLNFTHLAIAMSIFRPDKKAELQISDTDWQGMKAELEKLRKNNLFDFVELAMSMTILSAEKVKITDQGIELEMHGSDFKQEKTKRPERKTF